MHIVARLGFQILVLSLPILCCWRSSRSCTKKKITPLALSPIEKYRQEYKDNIHTRGQPTPSLKLDAESGRTNGSKCIACGSRALDNTEFIIHGQNAPEKYHPWQVHVRGRRISCGGVLIAPQWVITAAHCIARTVYIMLGDTILQNISSHTVYRKPILEIVHKRHRSFHNDIALIKMKTSVIYNDYIRPICLPKEKAEFSTANDCYLTGWGYTDYEAKLKTDKLQQVRVRLLDHQDCFITWLRANKVVTTKNVCTQRDPAFPNTGACFGDSGGPLACRDGDSYYLVGIASVVQKDCHKTFLPDLFVKISYYRQWIEENILKNDRG